MQKVISIDDTLLKTSYKGCLLIATAQDDNCHCFPIAWAVADSENNASWAWFLTKFQEIIPNTDDLVFISDRHQIIKKAVCSVYSNAHHGYCMWHIEQKLKSLYTCQDAIDLFKNAAQAYQISQFTQLWMEIQNRYPRVANYYLTTNITFGHWSRLISVVIGTIL